MEGINQKAHLFELAWEVCNQVGGIYRVIDSKIESAVSFWDKNYTLIGPYTSKSHSAFSALPLANNAIGKAIKALEKEGFKIHYGIWLAQNEPRVILLDIESVRHRLGDIKYFLWEHHHISTAKYDPLLEDVLCFGYMVQKFFEYLCATHFVKDKKVIAHFHEWMSASAIPELRRLNLNIYTVFTTHATVLGRYLAMNDSIFYEHLPFYDWKSEAERFNISTENDIERAATHGAHLFSTVSEVTNRECIHLLHRKADTLLPNGLNVERLSALHEFQNWHLQHKLKIEEFIRSHFFASYSFDLDKTLYFFTSGRSEYRNKGFDMVIEAMARLNWKLKESGSDKTVVLFVITRADHYSVQSKVIRNVTLLKEIKRLSQDIEKQIGSFLFNQATQGKGISMPDIKECVDNVSLLRLKRVLQTWKNEDLPSIVTHELIDEAKDEIMNMIKTCRLFNHKDDKVKVLYHPDFINPSNPILSMDYENFIRGCHLGIFPSYYEPWGYTPLECLVSGLPTATSDLAGFGNYIAGKYDRNMEGRGIYMVNRNKKHYDESANQLAEHLFNFTKLNRRERIVQRNKAEATSVDFGWDKLYKHYVDAYKTVLG